MTKASWTEDRENWRVWSGEERERACQWCYIWIPCRSSTRDHNWAFLVATKEICYLYLSCSSQSHLYSLGSHICLQIISVKKVLPNIQKPLWNQKILHCWCIFLQQCFPKMTCRQVKVYLKNMKRRYEKREFQLLSCLSEWDHVSIPHTIKRAVTDYRALYDPWVYGKTSDLIQHG